MAYLCVSENQNTTQNTELSEEVPKTNSDDKKFKEYWITGLQKAQKMHIMKKPYSDFK